jgi:hypothetical protein
MRWLLVIVFFSGLSLLLMRVALAALAGQPT